MKKGFDFLTISTSDKETQIQEFETIIGFELPPLYRIFLKNFEHGMLNFKIGRYFAGKLMGEWNKYNNYISYGPVSAQKNGVKVLHYFNEFYSFDKLKERWYYEGETDKYQAAQLLVIGSHGDVGTGLLCLGYGEDNYEKIIGVMDEGDPDDPEFPFILGTYADNIFEFVSMLVQEKDDYVKDGVEPVYPYPFTYDKVI